MAQIRLRIHLWEGAKSVDLARLGAIPEELNKFLRALGEDLGLRDEENRWRASKFGDGSLALSAIPPVEVSAAVVRKSADLTTAIAEGNPHRALSMGASERTLLRYVELAKSLHAGEHCRIGVYRSAKARAPTKWVSVTADSAANHAAVIQTTVEHEGAIFGVIHSLIKEGDRPHFDLRDLARGDLVKCYYRNEHYPQVVRALAVRDNRVHVSGLIRVDRLRREIESISVRQIEPAETLSEEDFQRFIGCAPGLTGDMATSEYIDQLRDD